MKTYQPFQANKISDFQMIFHNGGYIIFGGQYQGGQTSTTIARLYEMTREWSKLGQLLTARFRGRKVLFIKCFLKFRKMEIFFEKNFHSSPRQIRPWSNPRRAILFGNRWGCGSVGLQWVQASAHREVHNELQVTYLPQSATKT